MGQAVLVVVFKVQICATITDQIWFNDICSVYTSKTC